MFARKTECPVSRSEFLAGAKAVEVVLNGQRVMANAKEFTTFFKGGATSFYERSS